MASKDRMRDTFTEALEMGRHNAAIYPSVRSWCRHIVLKDESAGLIHQFYQVPMMTAISCPYTKGGTSGAALDWIASSFILENCINCPHHQSVSEPNFGIQVLEEKRKRDKIAAAALEVKKRTHRELRQQIDSLIAARKSSAGITELSILELINGLNDDSNKQTRAEQILEASRIDPALFSPLSIDALSLYFEDEKIGGISIQAVCAILKTRTGFPATVFQQAIKVIREGIHFNDAASLLPFYIHAGNIVEHEETLESLLNHLQYNRFFGEPFDHQRDYASSIACIFSLVQLDRPFMLGLFRQRIRSDDAVIRININYCIQDLMPFDLSIIKELMPELIMSLELVDNASGDSADHAVATTIAKFIKASPHENFQSIRTAIQRLNAAGREAESRIYRQLLQEKDFVTSHKDFCKDVAAGLLKQTMTKNEDPELKENYAEELHSLAGDHPDLLEPSFDSVLGWLIQIAEEEKTFLWWLEEIKNKKPEQVTTFNPLRGRSYDDIDNERNKRARLIDHIVDMLGHILEIDKGKHTASVKKILDELDSVEQPRLKKYLIKLIYRFVRDHRLMTGFIPSLYTWLFDAHAVEIRAEAMKFLDRLIDYFPQLLTQTLLDVAELFLKDNEVLVRGMAIEVQTSIVRGMPEKFNPNSLDTLIGCLGDPYVHIHKKTAEKCRFFFPLMNSRQQQISVISLFGIMKHYHQKDDRFFRDILIDFSIMTIHNPQWMDAAVEQFLIPNCRSGDYYVSKESIDLLSEIKKERKQFENVWLQFVIDKLRAIPPSFRSDMDWRAELYAQMHHLSYACIHRNLSLIKNFLESRTKEAGYDISNILQVLAYFEVHDAVVEYANGLSNRIEKLPASEWIFKFSNLIKEYCAYEKSLGSGRASTDHLKTIRNVFQAN